MESFDKDLCSVQEARNLARNGKKAANEMATFTQEQVDTILKSMRDAAKKHAVCLAQMAVEETGFGKAPDKVYKNHAASVLLYEEIKNQQTVGIISEDVEKGTFDVAEPVGLVMGIIPSTNPTSTVFFKAMIAIKSRNAIVFAPHPAAKKCTLAASEVMREAAEAAGAPKGLISCVSTPTMASTNELMHGDEVSLIIATGGPGMVKAAYSSGKPAIGVGAGNSPAYIERTANVKDAVEKIIASKTFDNGTICASEQAIICETVNQEEVISELNRQGGYFMSEEETDKVCQLLFKNGHAMNAQFVGRSADVIAEAAGISVPSGTKVLVGPQKGVGQGYPLSFEKLTTVLGFYVVNNWEEACHLSIELLQNGIGHTMSIHTNDRDMVLKFAAKPASRILVNTGGSQGGTGISTGLPISFTLGCGTFGGSSVSENVSPKNLLNIKKVAYGLKDVRTLVAEDTLFDYGLSEGAQEVTCDKGFSKSPADIQKSFEASNSLDVAKLEDVVKQLLKEMNQ